MPSHPLLRPFALGMHLLAVVLVAIAVGLGVWQVQAWQAQRDQEATDRTQLEPIPLTAALGADEPFPTAQVGRPVSVAGTWVPDGTIYVSGREHDDAEGYWAITPVAVSGAAGPGGEEPALLVVRGWTASVDDAPAPPTGPVELVGWLQPPEGSVGVSDDDRGDDVLPQVRMADAIQHVEQDLYGAYAVLDPDAPAVNAGADGLVPADLDQLPPAGRLTGLRNLLYGIEWWVFGLFAGFIWWRWCRDEVNARDERLRAPDNVKA